MSGESMTRAGRCALLLVLSVVCLLPAEALAQGETTSAIVGQVRDTTSAVVPGATVMITNPETGLRRSDNVKAKTYLRPHNVNLVRRI